MSLIKAQATPPWPAHEPTEKQVRLREHVRYCKEAVLQLITQVITTFFVMSLIGVSIAMPAGTWVLRDYLSHADLAWPSERGFNVFFTNHATDSQIASTAQTIASHAFVTDVQTIPKDVALREYLTAADLPDIAASIVENPLPDALTVFVSDSIQTTKVTELTDFIRALDAIDLVSYDPEIVVRFSAIASIFNRILWLIGVVFCLFALFVTATAVRIAIQSRLHEIRIWHIIGSPRRTIRGPFLWCGTLYGLLGGIFALVLLSLVLIYVEEPLSRLTASYGVSRNMQSLEWGVVVIVIGISAALGLTSALYSTWRYIRKVTLNWEI